MFDGRFRQGVDRGTKPVGTALVRIGVTADVLTVFGLAMSVLAAFVIGSGHLVWAIVMLFATGLPDLFDGPVAKAAGRTSLRGAFLDSVADRVSDAFLLGGVAWYLMARHHGQESLIPFAILAVTFLISYERAKAELLGLSAKGGLMERAERFVLLGVCFVAGAISASAFVPALWVFLGLVTATAVGRFAKVWRAAEGPAPAAARVGVSGPRWGERRKDRAMVRRRELADSRWRAWREARAQRQGSGARPMVPLGHRKDADTSRRVRVRRVGAFAGRGEGAERDGPTWRERQAWRVRRQLDRRSDSESS
jgi:CDP-diacylglycerol---glycerol-3-phosphate 3-phosphatidyltransferase